MPNNESPDHAGLRSDAIDKELILGARHIVDNMWARVGRVDTAELEHKICAFALDAYCKGRDSQSAELATLRTDRSRLNDEVNALAGQVQSLRYWLASGYCDCEDKDVKSSIPDSLERDWHHEVCEYRQRIEIMNGWQKPAEAK